MKKLVLILVFFAFCLGFFQACKSGKTTQTKSGKNIDNQQETILSRAKKQIGVKYKSGGTNSGGFDCSGFTRYCFEPAGFKLPPTALAQSKEGRHINLQDAKKADLIFFKGGDKNSKATGHVGIIVGGSGDNLEFIHASTSKGIMISKLSEKYFKERFIGIRRIIGVVELQN